MDKVVFSSDHLSSPGLTDQQRFKAWRDLYNQFVGNADLVPNEAPFEAHMAFVQAGDVMLGRMSVTIGRSEHGGRRATATDEGRMGLLVNIGANVIASFHRGHEELLAPGGSMLLSRSDSGRFTPLGDRTSWIIVDMPRDAVTRGAAKAEDLVGIPLRAGGEALRLVSGYAGLIFVESGFSNPRIESHISQTLLDLVGLAVGAEQDAAAIAEERGLRAARLDAVVQAIATGYADPGFSIAVVARKLGLSQRYVQDLLHSTGTGFAERVMELRLQHSVGLLARAHETRRKVSDIAFSCGFNDLSYFHRCFRRRFGMTPAGARA